MPNSPPKDTAFHGTKSLILGGVRSGKSQFAEHMAMDSPLPVTYIATAPSSKSDHEMQNRIRQHQQRRPAHWPLIEAPIKLAEALQQRAQQGQCCLVDCLTLWLTNLLMANDDAQFSHEREVFIKTLPTLEGTVILVSNESNMGITPLGELSRRYCNEVGLLHQELARLCDYVTLIVAGLPLKLKG